MPSKVCLHIPPADSPLVESLDKIPKYLVAVVEDLIYHLDRSVMLRVVNIPQPLWVSPYKLRLIILLTGKVELSTVPGLQFCSVGALIQP